MTDEINGIKGYRHHLVEAIRESISEELAQQLTQYLELVGRAEEINRKVSSSESIYKERWQEIGKYHFGVMEVFVGNSPELRSFFEYFKDLDWAKLEQTTSDRRSELEQMREFDGESDWFKIEDASVSALEQYCRVDTSSRSQLHDLAVQYCEIFGPNFGLAPRSTGTGR